jgi:hypothetical protein
MRFILKLILVIVILLGVAVGAAVVYLDQLAKAGIERGGTYALGVETSVDSVGIGLMSGKLSVDGLEVANPAGFSEPDFFRLKDARVDVQPRSLLESTIHVPLFALDGITLNIERIRGKSNYDAILQSLKKFESGGKPAEKSTGTGKQFVIDSLRITDVEAKVSYAPLGGQPSTVSVAVPEIRLKNVGSAQGGVDSAELIAVITKALLEAVTRAGIVPSEILKSLTSGLSGLGSVAIEVPEGVRGVAGKLLSGNGAGLVDELGKQAQDQLDKTGEVGKAIEGIGGLLGGKKKDEGK